MGKDKDNYSSVYDTLYSSGAISNLSSSASVSSPAIETTNFYDNNVVDIEGNTTPNFEQQERSIQESGRTVKSVESIEETNTRSILPAKPLLYFILYGEIMLLIVFIKLGIQLFKI